MGGICGKKDNNLFEGGMSSRNYCCYDFDQARKEICTNI